MRSFLLLIFLMQSLQAAEITGSLRVTNQPVARAIVYLGAGNGRAAATNIVLEVRDGVLLPHVQVATRGATLLLRNSDPTLRVVHVDALNATNAVRVFTQAMPYAGFQKAFTLDGFRDITLLRVAGGNGDPMSAYIAVLPHPWATLTDENGRFVLSGMPTGSYKLYAWHETLGTLVCEIKAPAAVDLEFTSTAPKRAD
jgi:hypothetical protein